jgi:hypothetical protein
MKQILILLLGALACVGSAKAGVVEVDGYFVSDTDAAALQLKASPTPAPTPTTARRDPYQVVARLAQTAAGTPEAGAARAELGRLGVPVPVHSAGGDLIDDALAYSKVLATFFQTHQLSGRIPSEKSMNLFLLLRTAATALGYGEYPGFDNTVMDELKRAGVLEQLGQ